MRRTTRLTLAAAAGLLAMQLTQAQSGSGMLPLSTRQLQFTGVAGAAAPAAALRLRTAELRFTGIAGR